MASADFLTINLVWATAAIFMAPALSVRPPRVRTHSFLSTHLPHLPLGIPSHYGTSVCFTPLSIPNWPYAVSVRQVRDLPAPSFRFHLTVSLLVFGYDLLEQSKDFHP